MVSDKLVRDWLEADKTPNRCPFLRGYYCLEAEVCKKAPEVYSCDSSVFMSLYHRRLNERAKGGNTCTTS